MDVEDKVGGVLDGVGLPTLVATVAVLLLAAYLSRKTKVEPLPGSLSQTGNIALDVSAFADEDEARRDLGRAYCARGLYATRADGAVPQLLDPPEDLPKGIEKEALESQYQAFTAAVERFRGTAPSASELSRLAAHLTVSPTISVLAAVNVAPMLLQNRFVIRLATDGSIRVLTMGYIGTPIAARTPAGAHAPYVLSVASPDLRDEATSDPSTLACTVSYSVRSARYPRIEEELAKVALHGN